MGAAERVDVGVVAGCEEQLGRYRLCREVATGGMATVYLAVTGDSGLEQVLAIKRIHPHLASQRAFVEMFLDEARIASRIHHPNVCGVVDLGAADGDFYLAMEYLEGVPLTAFLKGFACGAALGQRLRGPLMAASIVADACEGLHAAHELCDDEGRPLSVVHRDVSPHNLFLTWDGIVKVVDFGIATARNRLHHTATGLIKGKFAYMAPEQLAGLPVDRRADVWSLGVVLWEMLADRYLFRRKIDSQTILAVTRDPIPSIRSVRPSLPLELDAIVRQALSRDPAHRFQNAREMGRALSRWMTRNPQPVDAAELSDCLTELFPEGRDRQRELRRRALAGEVGGETPRPRALGNLPSRSAVRRRSLSPWPLALLGCVVAVVTLGFFVGRTVGGEFVDPNGGPTPVGLASVERTSPPPPARPAVALPAEASVIVAEAAAVTDESAAATVDAPSLHESTTESDALEEERPATRAVTEVARMLPSPGQVAITTPGGWAAVFLHGRALGHAPGRFTLPAGRHVLELRPAGGPDRHRVGVNVRPGRLTRVRVDATR